MKHVIFVGKNLFCGNGLSYIPNTEIESDTPQNLFSVICIYTNLVNKWAQFKLKTISANLRKGRAVERVGICGGQGRGAGGGGGGGEGAVG